MGEYRQDNWIAVHKITQAVVAHWPLQRGACLGSCNADSAVGIR